MYCEQNLDENLQYMPKLSIVIVTVVMYNYIERNGHIKFKLINFEKSTVTELIVCRRSLIYILTHTLFSVQSG